MTIVELAPTILPGQDEDVVKEATRVYGKQGLVLKTGVRVTGAERAGDVVRVTVQKEGAEPETLEADYALVDAALHPEPDEPAGP